jgi:biotin carboxyl carrier protein
VRFYLTANGVEAEVSVTRVRDGSERTLSTATPQGERRFVLGQDAVYEPCEDGSYRRRTLLPGPYNPSQWTFFHSGRVRTVYPVGGIAGRVESLTDGQGAVTAPMNGQVVKVLKNVGDSVESGEIVLILEAMKMENEVSAPQSGTLAELNVQPGQAVSPGQLLFRVDAAE